MSVAVEPGCNRNAPCPCGSGRRYKACCGRVTGGDGPGHVAGRVRLSVIVSLQHAHTLDIMLEALAAQEGIDRRDFEVVVVDALRRRDWREVVAARRRAFGGDLSLHFLEGAPASRARSLNMGLDAARGDIILFLADDFIPRPQVLAAHLAFHRAHPGVRAAGVGAGVFPERLRRSPFRRWLEDTGSLFGVAFSHPQVYLPPGFFYAAHSSVKRALLDRAGRFDERFPYDAWDDMEYGQRLVAVGYQATFLPGATCEHEHPVTLAERLGHMRNAGESAAIYERIHPQSQHPWRFRTQPMLAAPLPQPALSVWRRMTGAERVAYNKRRLDAAFVAGFLAEAGWQGRQEAGLAGADIAALLAAPAPVGGARRDAGNAGLASFPAGLGDQMDDALAAQRRGDLDTAERLYWHVLGKAPALPDALHMLGVVRYQRGRPEEGAGLILRAMACFPGDFPAMRTNLGYCLARLARLREATASDHPGGNSPPRPVSQPRPRLWPGEPLVSVLVPSYNHAGYVEAALRSVFRQTYRHIELIVIDDGSGDGSPDLIRRALVECPFPHRLISRANRGAPATLNEGIGIAQGYYLAVLNSDDRYAPGRIAGMVERLADQGGRWGFGNVRFIAAEGESHTPADTARVGHLVWLNGHLEELPAVSHAFLRANVAISTGNLFMERQFALECGGFRELRYNHDWDFCLRAIRRSEPVYWPERTYEYRLHAGNTIKESRAAARAEADAMLRQHLARVFSSDVAANPLAPAGGVWGDAVLLSCLEGGLGGLLPAPVLLALAQRLDLAVEPGLVAAGVSHSQGQIALAA